MVASRMDKSTASDIPAGNWVDRWLPVGTRPYARMARFDRPIGWWLLLFPCWWSVALASVGWPSLWMMFLFWLGAVVMRGAGCTFNDITDREFDAQVARTADRPLPSGDVSVGQAIAWLVVQSLVGLLVLIQFNDFAVMLGIASLGLIVIYPFMKRVTYWPQFFLGLAFNWGALLGWAAVRGDLDTPALLLYIAGIFWTLGYDTIYAHQDKEDDLIVGVKSSALALGERTRPALLIFYTGAIVFTGVAGWEAGLTWPFYLFLSAAAAQLAWQAGELEIEDPFDCLAKFKSNRLYGWLILAGIIAGRVAA
jgi:4-hydroxybenzoate polyprenyltransferase